MKTRCSTSWWDRESGTWQTLPADLEIRVLADCELEQFVDANEARALRECRERMKRDQAVVFCLYDGWVACWLREQLEESEKIKGTPEPYGKYWWFCESCNAKHHFDAGTCRACKVGELRKELARR